MFSSVTTKEPVEKEEQAPTDPATEQKTSKMDLTLTRALSGPAVRGETSSPSSMKSSFRAGPASSLLRVFRNSLLTLGREELASQRCPGSGSAYKWLPEDPVPPGGVRTVSLRLRAWPAGPLGAPAERAGGFRLVKGWNPSIIECFSDRAESLHCLGNVIF